MIDLFTLVNVEIIIFRCDNCDDYNERSDDIFKLDKITQSHIDNCYQLGSFDNSRMVEGELNK